MDETRRLRAQIYFKMDILNTERQQLEKSLDLLHERVLIDPELKERFKEQIQEAQKIEKNSKEVIAIIMEILESGGSKEAIQKAERLRDRLNGS